eukprot:762827-Pyramimonas_sp.AAC.1
MVDYQEDGTSDSEPRWAHLSPPTERPRPFGGRADFPAAQQHEANALVDEVGRICSLVASGNMPPGCAWRRVLVPFMWESVSENGRAALAAAFREVNLDL